MADYTLDKLIEDKVTKFLKTQTGISGLETFSENEDISINRESDLRDSFVCSVGSIYVEVKASAAHLSTAESKLHAEYEANVFLSTFLPTHGQKPITYVKEHDIMVLDVVPDGYKSLWSEIFESRVDKVTIHQLAMVLGKLHKMSHDRKYPTLNVGGKEELRMATFVEPYGSALDGGHVLQDPLMRSKIQALERIFSEKQDCLIHGSMSLVNISTKQGHPIVRNFCFSTTGPFGFDLGTLLASYMSLYHLHMLTPENNDAHRRVAYKMMDACKTTLSTYLEGIEETLSQPEIQSLISDTAGFAACELIKRSLTMPYPGISKHSINKEIMESGIRLLRQYESIHDIGRLLMIGLMLC